MFTHLSPAEARQTPIYAAVLAKYLAGPAYYCRQAACERSMASHKWDPETCPKPEAAEAEAVAR